MKYVGGMASYAVLLEAPAWMYDDIMIAMAGEAEGSRIEALEAEQRERVASGKA